MLTHEDIVRLWTLATNLEELHEVEELTMDITTDLECQTRCLGRSSDSQ